MPKAQPLGGGQVEQSEAVVRPQQIEAAAALGCPAAGLVPGQRQPDPWLLGLEEEEVYHVAATAANLHAGYHGRHVLLYALLVAVVAVGSELSC